MIIDVTGRIRPQTRYPGSLLRQPLDLPAERDVVG
jgi:hypothetical protein